MAIKMRKRRPRTLADFSVPLPLYCHHCEKRFVKRSPLYPSKGYVMVQCTKCRLMTPFRLEAA
jgi:hypothetical protein